MSFPSTVPGVSAHICHTHLYPHLSNFYLSLSDPPGTRLSTSCSGYRSVQHWSQQNMHLATLMPWSHKHSDGTPCAVSFFMVLHTMPAPFPFGQELPVSQQTAQSCQTPSSSQLISLTNIDKPPSDCAAHTVGSIFKLNRQKR